MPRFLEGRVAEHPATVSPEESTPVPGVTTVAEHPNCALVRKFFEAFASVDTSTLSSLVTEDLVWRLPIESAALGPRDHCGFDKVASLGVRVLDLTDATFAFDVHGVFGADDCAAAVAHLTGEREGRKLSLRSVLWFRIRDGEIAEATEVPDDVGAWSEFWS